MHPRVDPVPPAFLRGSQMQVGNGDENAGLENAAERSPALRTCEPEDSGPPEGGGDDV